MSQRRTAPSSLPELSGLYRVALSLQETARWLCNAKLRRQCLACYFATITMGLAGTVYGWTKASLVHLTNASGDVPLTLTHDEYSWVVSLTVVGSMIGSLLAAQLADCIGRIYCLVVCSTMFFVGWFIIYIATSVPMLYLAGVTLGIGVGIAHTINPMFVSEVADIKYRGPLSVLIAANVNSGTLLSYALAISMTYKSQPVLLVGISIISMLSIACFPETPYFLVAKGQKEQACKSIAYYKGIEDPHKVKIEQRGLRDQVRYELVQQFSDELHQQSGSDLHSQSRRDLPPQSRSDLPSQSRRDLPSQSRRDLPSQSRRDLPPQSRSDLPSQSSCDLPSQPRREAHSDSFWEVVDTEPTSDFNLPSSSDSPSLSTSVIHSEVICEVHPQPTSELHLQSSRELHSQSTSEIHQPSTSEIHRSSTSEIHRPSTSEVHRPSTSEKHSQSTSELHRLSAREIHPLSTSEIHRPSASEIHRPSTSQIDQISTSEKHSQSTSEEHSQSTSELHPLSTSEIHPLSTSEIHRPSTSQIHRPSTSQIHRPSTSQIDQISTSEKHSQSTSEEHSQSTSELHHLSTSEIHPLSTSEIHRPSTSQIHRPSTSQILPQTGSELHPRSTSNLLIQSNVDSRASTDIPETYIGVTKYTCLNKLREILQRSNRKALFIMLGLIMAQQLSGDITATQYLAELIDRKTASVDLHEAMTLVQVVRHVCGYTMTVIVAYLGRRTLLILSTIGSCISLFLVAAYLFLDLQKFDNRIVSILPVYFLSCYQVSFQVGLGMLPNVLLCDLFPTELKGIVGAIVVIFNGIIGFTVSKLNQVITDNVGSYAIFFISATSCTVAFLMVFIWVPETKGKTYCEIEALLVGENLNSLNEEVRTNEMNIRRI